MKITRQQLKKIIKEEFSKVLRENEEIKTQIEALIANGVSAETRFVANLKMALAKLGFDEGDMFFNEDYPASLSFGNDWGDLGAWVLVLEGKCIQRGTCLVEN